MYHSIFKHHLFIVPDSDHAPIRDPHRCRMPWSIEVISTDIDFVSRYLAITKLPDGTVAGADHEMDMYTVQL